MQFRVSVSAPEGVVLYAVLHHNRQTLEQTNQQVEVKREGTTVTFDLMLRQFGFHCLSIYALVCRKSHSNIRFYLQCFLLILWYVEDTTPVFGYIV